MTRASFLAAIVAGILVLPVLADDAMKPVDLSTANADFALTMPAPEGATVKDDIGDVDVLAGDGFQIVVHSSESDIAAAKKEITANTINKLKQFTTDEADTLVYESEVMGKSEFHFLTNVKVGDKTYGIEDNKGPSYTADQVKMMVASAKGLAAK